MPPRSLVAMCLRIATENAHEISSLDGVPDYAAQKILQSVKSSAVLYKLEQNNEWLHEQTEEIWKRFIERDFAHLRRKAVDFAPTIPGQWSTAYDQYKECEDRNNREAEERLRATFSNLNSQAESRTISNLSFNATKYLISTQKKKSSGWPSSSSSGFRPSPMRKGNAFDKAKREARLEQHRRQINATTPLRQTSTLKKAPVAMVEAKRIARQPGLIRPIRGPVEESEIEIQRKLIENRESRLLAIKNDISRKAAAQRNAPKAEPAAVVGDDDDDHIFGDKEHNASSPDSASSPPSTSSYSNSEPSRTGLKRKHGGLLSNAPGANSRYLLAQKVPRAPPRRVPGAILISPPKPTSEHANKRQRRT